MCGLKKNLTFAAANGRLVIWSFGRLGFNYLPAIGNFPKQPNNQTSKRLNNERQSGNRGKPGEG